MNSLNIFLAAKIEDHGFVAGVADFFLTPVRYLWNGKNVRIIVHQPTSENRGYTEMHHVKSFHKEGSAHTSKSNPALRSSSKNLLKTTLAIMTFCPGLILGSLLKAFSVTYDNLKAYFSKPAPDYWGLLKLHFTPETRFIGRDFPLDKDGIEEEVKIKKRETLNQKTENLIVHGKGDIVYNNSSSIFSLGAKKVILVDITMNEEDIHLDASSPTLAIHQQFNSVEDALNDTPKKRYDDNGRRIVDVYLIQSSAN
jgi:hypothetical protein